MSESFAVSTARIGRPVPTMRALRFALIALAPAVLSVLAPGLVWLTLAIDTAVVLLVAVDFWRAPLPSSLRVRRVVEPVLSSGRTNPVKLLLESARPVWGELRDTLASGPDVVGNRQRFECTAHAQLTWHLTPLTRGDLRFGDVWVRLEGPLGLCARQFSIPLEQHVKVYPDLIALSKDALTLARAASSEARRVVRVRSDGREFESLREYRVGDDKRSLDWKATARRGKPMVRLHQPERNQVVLLLLDCGRHMAGEVDGRRKLDHAVDAALRLAKVALDRGDLVGVMAFAAGVKAWLPPRKGAEHLRAVTNALYRVEASLEESDYGQAIDLAFARGARRSLVVLLTDLLDADAADAMLKRVRRLAPRHVPLVASLLDEGVQRVARSVPTHLTEAHERRVAAQLERDVKHTVMRLQEGGARVLRTSAQEFGPGAVSAYLDLKARGVL